MPTIAGTDYRKTAALSDHALGDRFFASYRARLRDHRRRGVVQNNRVLLVVRKVPQRRSTRCYGGSEYIANGLSKQFVSTSAYASTGAGRMDSSSEQGFRCVNVAHPHDNLRIHDEVFDGHLFAPALLEQELAAERIA